MNRPYTSDLIDGTALWRSAEELSAAYAGAGVDSDAAVVVHCRTGHQASQTYFLLKHILGVKDVKWFDGSWMVWAGRSDLPAAIN